MSRIRGPAEDLFDFVCPACATLAGPTLNSYAIRTEPNCAVCGERMQLGAESKPVGGLAPAAVVDRLRAPLIRKDANHPMNAARALISLWRTRAATIPANLPDAVVAYETAATELSAWCQAPDGDEQKDIDYRARNMARNLVAVRRLSTLEEARVFAQNWIEEAAQHSRNEDYWRGRAMKAEAELVRKNEKE